MTNKSRTTVKYFWGVDFLKFLMAIVIVSRHTISLDGISNPWVFNLVDNLGSMAVRYFFVASGYFLFMKMTDNLNAQVNLNRLKGYIIRIGKLYLIWTLIYIPLTLYGYFHNDHGVIADTVIFFRNLFLKGQHFYSWPLWYMLSLLYSLFLTYYLIHKGKGVRFIFFAALAMYFLSVLMTSLTENESASGLAEVLGKLIDSSFGSGRLFWGMIYVTIGILYARNRLHIPKYIMIPMVFVCMAFQVYEIVFLSDFALMFLIAMMFQISMNINISSYKSGYWFRKISVVMYFTHMIFVFLYTLIFKEFRYFGLDVFIISAISTVLLSFPVLYLESRYKWLKLIF